MLVEYLATVLVLGAETVERWTELVWASVVVCLRVVVGELLLRVVVFSGEGVGSTDAEVVAARLSVGEGATQPDGVTQSDFVCGSVTVGTMVEVWVGTSVTVGFVVRVALWGRDFVGVSGMEFDSVGSWDEVAVRGSVEEGVSACVTVGVLGTVAEGVGRRLSVGVCVLPATVTVEAAVWVCVMAGVSVLVGVGGGTSV